MPKCNEIKIDHYTREQLLASAELISKEADKEKIDIESLREILLEAATLLNLCIVKQYFSAAREMKE